MTRLPLPSLILALWIALIGALVWGAAVSAVEPPVWDSMSYFAKGMNFWKAVAADAAFNPFNIEPTVRPPGTVLMSHPFGFAESYYGFYFRSVFIPLLLLTAAVLIVNPEDRITPTTVALAIAFTSMPMLYQFQANDLVPWEVNWGMVDNFMAGVAAVSAAAVVRSVRRASAVWAVIAALAAALCFLIKPSGLLVMGLAGFAWATLLLWDNRAALPALWTDRRNRAFVLGGTVGATIVFAATAFLAFTSDYFSLENVTFGNRVIAILSEEITASVGLKDLALLINISLGALLTALGVAGLIAAVRARSFGVVAAASVTALSGIWFWFFATEPWEPRYFAPFGIMALVLVVPHLIAAIHALPGPARTAVTVVLVLPAVITAALLASPAPPLGVQRALGINLTTTLFKDETAQAHALLRHLRDTGAARSSAYVFNISMPQRAFQAVLNYVNLVDSSSPQISIASPIDWQRPSAYRLEEMSRAGFLVFEPVTDAAIRNAILNTRDVPDFYAQTRTVSAWATTLDETHGVQRISETQLRVLKIIDSAKFESAFNTFASEHTWPDSFRQGNQPRWWAAAELEREITRGVIKAADTAFHKDDATSPAIVHAVSFQQGATLDVDVWVHSDLEPGWVLFGHVVDQNGTMLLNAQANLVDAAAPADGRNIRRYTLAYADWPQTATGIAIGFFKPRGNEMDFLQAASGQRDWDNRRLVISRATP